MDAVAATGRQKGWLNAMATGYEPMTDEELEEIDEWLHDGEGVSFGQQVRLADEVERQRAIIAEQQAQLAAMRPIVAAVAIEIDPEDDHFFCSRCVSTAGLWLGHTHEMVHEPDCIVVQARACLAAHPETTTAESER